MCGFLPWLLTPHIHVHSANPTSSVVSCLDLHRAGKRSLLVSWKAFWLERTSVYLFGHFATEHSSIKELLEPAGAPRNHQSSQTQCTAACCLGRGALCGGAVPHIGSTVRTPTEALCRGSLCRCSVFWPQGFSVSLFSWLCCPPRSDSSSELYWLTRGSQSPSLSPSPEVCMLQRCLQLSGSWQSALQRALCAPENRLLMLICF